MLFTRRKIIFISAFALFFIMFSCVNMYAFHLSYEKASPETEADKAFGSMTSMCVPPDTDRNEKFEPLPDLYVRGNRVSSFFSSFGADKGFTDNSKEYSDKNINIKDSAFIKSFCVMRC